MKTLKKRILAFCGLLAVLMTVVTGCSSAEKEKNVVEGSGSWVEYSFEEAVEEAELIIYGTAGEQGESKVREGTDGKSAIDYYHEVPVTVKELVKGEGSGTVTYKEYGGETADTVYKVLDFVPLENGQEYVLFMDKDGFPLVPYAVAQVKDGVVSPGLLPESAKGEDGKAPESIPVDEYITMIEEAI